MQAFIPEMYTHIYDESNFAGAQGCFVISMLTVTTIPLKNVTVSVKQYFELINGLDVVCLWLSVYKG